MFIPVVSPFASVRPLHPTIRNNAIINGTLRARAGSADGRAGENRLAKGVSFAGSLVRCFITLRRFDFMAFGELAARSRRRAATSRKARSRSLANGLISAAVFSASAGSIPTGRKPG